MVLDIVVARCQWCWCILSNSYKKPLGYMLPPPLQDIICKQAQLGRITAVRYPKKAPREPRTSVHSTTR